MIRRIDSLSYNNRLRALSPMWKSGFAASALILTYLAHPPVQLFLLLWLCWWTLGYARIPARFYLLLLGASCAFYAASLPALLVEFAWAAPAGQPPLLPANSMVLLTLDSGTAYISPSGSHTAILLGMRVLTCSACLLFLILTTPVSELFSVLRKLRIPPLVLELMLIMYRFLFLLTDTAQEMYTAQRARGGHAGFRSRLRDTAMLIVRLFGRTMQRYTAVSHGLLARGFTDELRMAPCLPRPVPLRYRQESTAVMALLLCIEIWLRWSETTA